MCKYLNKFFQKKNPISKEYFECFTKPTLYKGFRIFHRVNSVLPVSSGAHIFDIVDNNNVCIGMYAGINGAKKFIDSIKQ